MSTEAERYARIAERVRVAHDRARRAFLQRLAAEQASIGTTAREQSDEVQAVLRAGGPHVVEHVRAALVEAELEQARNIMDVIARAPTPVIERMAALQVSIGTAMPDHPTELSASLIRGRGEARARTRDAFEPAARFRARVGPAREATIAQVRTGLANGASIRQIAQGIRSEASPPPVVPAYVQSVMSALSAQGTPPGAFMALAGDVRVALRGMGSATNAQSWRTIRPAVEKLAKALESGNTDRMHAALANFVETKMRFEAARIARTEAARAATRAAVDQAQRTPGVTCLEWIVSREHPVEDICDVYASADLFGYGPGRYPLDRPPELPAHPNCFPAGTQIETQRGAIGIEHIVAGDTVRAHTGAWRRVLRTMARPHVGGLVRIVAGGHEITCTDEHPILTGRGWVLANALHERDHVYVRLHVLGFAQVRVAHVGRVPFEGVVYNFAVDVDESYVANAIVVHNCLCTLRPVLTPESITRALRREPHPEPGRPRDASPEAWLLRQPAARQALVVGSSAAALMRNGAQVFAPNGTVLALGAIRPPS